MKSSQDTGIVAIGRNEGERLRVCLESAIPHARHVVYVDSGSTDGSLEMARERGVTVVELDTDRPFTAARARNAGFEALEALFAAASSDSEFAFVQFIDGDCELEAGWMPHAREVMETDDRVVVVCGRRAERYPEATVYNLLCDMEWDTPIGDALACGGDALMRVRDFRAVGGFRADLIAGEEPELCARLRRRGGRIERTDAPMTLHDARIDSFSQWWMRTVRTGYAYAESAAGEVTPAREDAPGNSRSTWIWGFAMPVAILLALLSGHFIIALLLVALFPVQVARIALRNPCPGFSNTEQWIYAVGCVIGKIPNIQGELRYWIGRITGRRSKLIEYKGPEESDSVSGTVTPGGSA